MGCDYYIQPYLKIHHSKGISYYNLPIIRGYYSDLECGVYDSDDDEKHLYYNSKEYVKLFNNMIKICLTPRKKVVIYKNNSFINSKFEKKYLPIIQNIINGNYDDEYIPCDDDIETFTSIDQIIKITKKEKRYAR